MLITIDYLLWFPSEQMYQFISPGMHCSGLLINEVKCNNVLQVGNLASMRFESFYIVHDFNEQLTRI